MMGEPFKQSDIQNCACCDRGLMHPENRLGMFWRIGLERMIVDHRAVARQHGLELMLGGGCRGAAIARVMGCDDDMAVPVGAAADVLICEYCVMTRPMAALFDAIEGKERGRTENPDQTRNLVP